MIQQIKHLNLKHDDETKWRYDNSNITFKTSMIRSDLRDYSDTYIPFNRTITVPNRAATGTATNNTNKRLIFKKCATFTDCITKINDTQVDDAQNIDVVMPIYNLIEYRDACLKTSGSSWQYYRDEPALYANNNNIINFPANTMNIALFKF